MRGTGVKRAATALAAVLSLALAGPAAAAEGHVTESFSIVRTLSIIIDTGSSRPTSEGAIDYGSIEPGFPSEPFDYSVLVGNGAESAWNLTVAGSDFSGPNGATMPSEIRRATFGGPSVVAPYAGADGHAVTGSPILVAHADANSGSDVSVVHVSQWIDLQLTYAGPSGDYAGTTTWTVSAP